MKIALCLSGQPRAFNQGYEFVHKNLLKDNDVTVFIHTWQSPEAHEAIMKYQAKTWQIDPALTNDLSKYTNVPPPQPNWKVKDPARATWNQLYGVMMCNSLKSEFELLYDMKFDWVIRSRFDFALNTAIDFGSLDNSKLYIPNCRMTPARDFGNDQFAMSSSANMDKYADAFNHIDAFYNDGTVMISEDMMSQNWKLHGLVGEKLVYCNMNHPFPPGPNNGTWHSLIRGDFDKWQKS